MTDDFESTKFEEPDPEELERLFAKAARIFSAKSAPPAPVPELISVGSHRSGKHSAAQVDH